MEEVTIQELKDRLREWRMEEVSIRDLKNRASAVVRRVRELKKPVAITHRGRIVAKLSPVDTPEDRAAEDERILAEMETLAKEIGARWPAGISAVDAVREQRRDL